MVLPYETFAALAECIRQSDAGAPAERRVPAGPFIEACVARLQPLPHDKRNRFALGVHLLGSRAAVLVAIGQPRRFSALSAADRTRCFEAYGTSSLPALRSAYEAVRRLVLAVHYADTDVAASTGYDGPMHTRTPRVAWEGALAGTERDSEPVARELTHRTAPAPRAMPRGVLPPAAGTGDTHRTADVVVIGTGAGGAVTAARLAAAGFDTVLLEEGAYHLPSDFTEAEAKLTETLYADGALRTTDDLSVALVQGRSVGGSTTVNWMIMLRTPDRVLEEWYRDHGTVGMLPADMAPAFDRIEARVHARAVPADAHSANNRIVLDGAAALGWRASSAIINAHGCIRCGFCGVGCRHDAKQSTLVTYVPDALERGATLYTGAHADRIELRERQGSVSTPARKRVHARVTGADGVSHTLVIDAPLVVIAAGAIGTPVLLQRSGLGGGGVGSWMRLHPTTAVFGRYARDIVSSTGIPLSTICDEFSEWNGSPYGFWIECPPMHPSFSAAAMPGFGATHAARMATMRQQGVLIALTRDGAQRLHSSGRVRAGRDGAVGIRYRLTDADRARVRASVTAAARLHLAAGAIEAGTLHTNPVICRTERDIQLLGSAAYGPNRIGLFSAHVNGTCRMGTDPATSGATPDGERHGVRGLYITDGSLLPTAPGVNPQETIMAVATVLADRIVDRHAGMTRV
ncbi:MAG TPA: GMC family oxidoreductase [Gemmatimonas sp.]|nr:GMC family oxidoreductase [Gemmatimonas sp.]